MSEGNEPRHGPEPGSAGDVDAPQEHPGRDKEDATEKIGEDAKKGQTQAPAPDDDVGSGDRR